MRGLKASRFGLDMLIGDQGPLAFLGSSRWGVLLGTAACLLVAACGDGGGSGPKGDKAPLETPDDPDAPLQLSYVCGNRFVITNSNLFPVTVAYRVDGSDEEGTATVDAGADADPWYSEQMIETHSRGKVLLSFAGRLVQIRDNANIPCSPPSVAASAALVSSDPADAGQWTAPFPWPIIAVHLVLLPNGKVLSLDWTQIPQLWDPATGAFTAIPSPALVFCGGQALDADGNVVFAGGHISDKHGIPNITLWNSDANVWSGGGQMAHGRWYPTITTMGNGEAVITAGTDEAGVAVPMPEVLTAGSIRQLTSITKAIPYYPRAFLAPNGKLFYAGEPQKTRYLDYSGTGKWSLVASRLWPDRNFGAAVMYDVGKILFVGGGHITNTAETIDLVGAPFWTWTGSMAFARRNLNATVLPTGQVLVTGGVAGKGTNDLTAPVHAAEIWDPTTGVWTTLASNVITRGYHSTAILLPDGRVLATGSGTKKGPKEYNAEIFSPPYLFRGDRPVIEEVPKNVDYNSTFRLDTETPLSISKVSLIRLGATTHAFDMNQRFQHLAFTADEEGLTVTAPTDRNVTPPGHYMLFILNQNDVPSVAQIVKVR